MPTVLILLLVVPLATAIVVAFVGCARMVRWLSLLSTLVSLGLAVGASLDFAAERLAGSTAAKTMFEPQHVVRFDLITFGSAARFGPIQFYIGLDGLNVWLILLTALLIVTGVLCSWKAVTERVNEFHAWLLALQVAMTGVFLSFDVILFYVFFELTLVPLFFLIGIWGGPERQYAARKFFVFTLAGSLITLVGVLGAVVALGQPLGTETAKPITFSIPELVSRSNHRSAAVVEDVDKRRVAWDKAEVAEKREKREELDRAVERADYWHKVQFWVFLGMMVGFAVKVPLVPVHTWLPLAHVQAPTAGSVLLAGILLKLGTYGFLRLSLPLLPDASLSIGAPVIGWLAVIGIIYGSFCALAQDDIKKIIAYSSVAHLGFCMLGLFALNLKGLSGGLLQMINHGLSTGALFLVFGMLYERYHTRKMADYSGMAARLKLLAAAMVFATLASIGLPGLNGFVGEVLVLFGMFDSAAGTIAGRTLAVIASVGMLLGAWYMLTMLRQVFFGPLREPHHDGHEVKDLDGREIATLVPIGLLCLLLGIYPKPFLDSVKPELEYVANIAKDAQQRATPTTATGVDLA